MRFEIENLKNLDQEIDATIIAKVAKMSGSDRQCRAYNKKNRCSSSSKKDRDICARHVYRSDILGIELVLAEVDMSDDLLMDGPKVFDCILTLTLLVQGF